MQEQANRALGDRALTSAYLKPKIKTSPVPFLGSENYPTAGIFLAGEIFAYADEICGFEIGERGNTQSQAIGECRSKRKQTKGR